MGGKMSNEYYREYYKNNKEKIKVINKKWESNNKEQKLEINRLYRKKNKKKCKLYEKEYRARFPEKSRAKLAKRRASKLQQTPKWADLKAIEEFYKNCPNGYHVDHIIPLQGKNVRGLHILENLQYLPAIENIKKGNKYGL